LLHNELSDKMAEMLCFSFDRIICESLAKKLTGWKFILDAQNVSAIGNLYRKDFRIIYITFKWPTKKIDSLENELDELGCLYSGVVKVADNTSLKAYLKRHESFYLDTDKELVQEMYPYGIMWADYLNQVWK
jgi:hypothetical protein